MLLSGGNKQNRFRTDARELSAFTTMTSVTATADGSRKKHVRCDGILPLAGGQPRHLLRRDTVCDGHNGNYDADDGKAEESDGGGVKPSSFLSCCNGTSNFPSKSTHNLLIGKTWMRHAARQIL
jgi:hypothetical protein